MGSALTTQRDGHELPAAMSDPLGRSLAFARNHLLARQPEPVRQRLLAGLQPVRLAPGQTLQAASERIDSVYFITSGWVSLTVGFADGFQAETGLVGPEGMIGLGVVLGVDSDVTDATVQAPGEALRMDARLFRQELEALPELLRTLLRYSEAMLSLARQVAACNGHHTLEQRLARWLLMVQDRTGASELPITQELLATMLCVHRPSVSAAAARLQRNGIIRHSAGTVLIHDRAGLEGASCECYAAIRSRFRTGPE